MSDIPIYPIEDAEGNPAAVQVYENGVFHNNGNPVGCVTEEDAIAQKFDTTASFAKGTYCMQNHKMQKFKAAKSAGAWDSSKADQTTVGNELTQLNSTLADVNSTLAGTTINLDNYGYTTLTKIGNLIYICMKVSGISDFPTVPAGYRPTSTAYGSGYYKYMSAYLPAVFTVSSDGTISGRHYLLNNGSLTSQVITSRANSQCSIVYTIS